MKMTKEEFARKHVISANGRSAICTCDTCGKISYYDLNTARAAAEHDAPLHCSHCDSWTAYVERSETDETPEEAPHASVS